MEINKRRNEKNKENINELMFVPDGLRVYDADEGVDNYPVQGGPYLEYHFNDKPHCAFGNIGNFLYCAHPKLPLIKIKKIQIYF